MGPTAPLHALIPHLQGVSIRRWFLPFLGGFSGSDWNEVLFIHSCKWKIMWRLRLMNNCAFRSKHWMLNGRYLSELSSERLSLMKPLASKYYLTLFRYSSFVLLIPESRGRHTDGQVRKVVLEMTLFFALICVPSSLRQHLHPHGRDTRICGGHADDAPGCPEGWHGKPGQLLGHWRCVTALCLDHCKTEAIPFLGHSQQRDGVRGCKSHHLWQDACRLCWHFHNLNHLE